MVNFQNTSELCEELNRKLQEREILPEDVDERERLLRPLEISLASSPSAPQVPRDSVAGNLISLLWYKSHPEEADPTSLFADLHHTSPLVRLTAASAISATLKSSHPYWSETRSVNEARQALVDSRDAETSPIIGYQLNQLIVEVGKLRRTPKKRRRPRPRVNPYVAGLPVHGRGKFFGRDDILTDIENSFVHRQGQKSIVLYGARRTGKTSVLLQIKDGGLGKKFLPVYLDMQALAGTDLQSFISTLLRNTKAAVSEQFELAWDKLPDIQGKTDFGIMQPFLHGILSELDDQALLLMIDEYEVLQRYLLEDSDLAQQFQSLLEQEPKLYVIFAGSHKLESLRQKRFSLLLDNARYIKISFLKKEDALNLIEEPVADFFTYDEGVPEQILKHTNGHPFYTQLLCQLIFDNVGSAPTATLEHVESAVEQFMINPSPHLILTWNGISREQKIVAAALAELYSEVEPFQGPAELGNRIRSDDSPAKLTQSEIQKALNDLRTIDWIEKKPGMNAYGYTMELVRRWVVDNHSILDLAQALHEKLLSQVATFWRQIAALAIDFGICFVVSLLLMTLLDALRPLIDAAWLIIVPLMICYIYLLVPLLISGSTLGERLLGLSLIGETAGTPSQFRLAVYAFFLLLRLTMVVPVIGLVFAIFANLATVSRVDVVWLLVFLFFTMWLCLDVLMLLFGKKHQGLYEKVTRLLVVRVIA